MSKWIFQILYIYFDALAGASLRIFHYLPRPRLSNLKQIGKAPRMAKGWRYTVDLTPAVDADVVSRDLSVNVAGVVTVVSGTHDTIQLTFDALDGAHVILILTDVDSAGNKSVPSAPLEFDASDQLPPAQPGLLNIKEIAEIDIP